jgi:hypothetical protein
MCTVQGFLLTFAFAIGFWPLAVGLGRDADVG